MVTDFESLQSEFYHYMVTVGGIAKKTSRDYISRLKFLAETGGYKLDSNITSEYIDEIMNTDTVVAETKLNIDGMYFDTPEKVMKFKEHTDIRISLLLDANKEYGQTKKELAKKLLTDEKLETFAVSYAVNFHDRNLEKQQQEINAATQKLGEDKAKFDKMEKPGLFSFDYREQYNAVKNRIEKDEAGA